MNIKKRILAAVMSAAVTVCGMSGSFSAFAAAAVEMDKPEYYAGEKCTATYSGLEGSYPWWGVYWQSETPGMPGVGSRFWNNIPAGSGSIDFNSLAGGCATNWSEIAAGEYKLCLFGDESKNSSGAYNVLAQRDFRVVKSTIKPQAPKSVTYERNNGLKNGFANGKITITPPDSTENMTGYAALWGDDSAPFAGYAPIKINGIKDSGKSVKTYKLVDNTFIPAGATRLYVYSAAGTAIKLYPNDLSLSETAATATLPEGAALKADKPLYSFQVSSDWHVFGGSEDNIKAKRLNNMLCDVKENAPGSTAIIGVGDVTDNSLDDGSMPGISPEKALSEYKVLKSVIEKNKADLPPMLFAVGNHDLRGFDGYEAQLARFLENTGTTGTNGKPYYYRELNGAKLVFLGSEHTCDNEYNTAELSKTQLEWFEKTLRENSTAAEPIFVFLHQPLKETVSGTTNGNRWYGVSQDLQLHNILKKYPQAVMFTGHTHWELESADPMFTGYGKDFTGFNDAGLGKLYTDENKDKEGSQGIYVEAYKDKLIVKGRDFENKLWVTSAQFIVDTTLPALEKAKSMSKTPSEILNNGDEINSLFGALDKMGADKGEFSEAFEIIKNAKTVLDGMDSVVVSFKTELELLKQQYTDKKVDSALLIKLKNQYAEFTQDQKEFLDGTDVVLSNVIKYEQAKNQAKLSSLTVTDKNNNAYKCDKNGNTFTASLLAGVDLRQLKLSPDVDKDAAVYINGAEYKDSAVIDLSGKYAEITVVSPLNDEIYNSKYLLCINVEDPAVIKNGWIYENGKYYFYSDGKIKANVIAKDKSGREYCAGKNGERVKNCVYTVGGVAYAFDRNGVRITRTGFVTLNKGVYFVKSGKALKSKTFKYKGRTYAVGANGKKLYGKKVVKAAGKLYYVDKKAAL